MVDYKKRFVEVDEILNYLVRSDYEKIPKEIIQIIKENKDQEYEWEYDETKPLKEQNVSRDTIAFLSYINMEYLLNEKQKAYMQKLHEINEKKKLQEEYSNEEKYNYSNLFQQKNKNTKDENELVEQTDLIKYKESFIKKIVNKIKSVFNIN